jgi:hypothetical protein
MFTLAPNASTAKTTQRSRLRIAPRDLVERFGPPLPASADRKVAGSYIFTDLQDNGLNGVLTSLSASVGTMYIVSRCSSVWGELFDQGDNDFGAI